MKEPETKVQHGSVEQVHTEKHTSSLAGNYLVSISQSKSDYKWSLYDIDEITHGMDIVANGERSTKALSTPKPITSASPIVDLNCVQTEDDVLEIEVTDLKSEESVPKDLVLVLQSIFLQWSARQLSTDSSTKEWKVSIGSSNDVMYSDLSSESALEELFSSFVQDFSSDEWVEMVTGDGSILGQLPRSLVHTFNILHRGIGLFVTKDEPMDETKGIFPPLYVHRRVDNKRVFPSLYDMFVGGVSLASEPSELTARREVTEELGLSRALEDTDALSNPVLECVICTELNRCVVTLFCYTMDMSKETLSWQEEEVAWGDFVPYPIIVAAADRSIQRLAETKEWPGAYPPIQSSMKGSPPEGVSYEGDSWINWDFVPDGLLVWEAWLRKLADHSFN